MDAVRITTEKCPKPGGWYSQAFRTGNLIFTAGVTANDPVTQELVGPGDIVKQTEQVLKNMDNLLREAGSDLAHVIKTLVFVSEMTLRYLMKPIKSISLIIPLPAARCRLENSTTAW